MSAWTLVASTNARASSPPLTTSAINTTGANLLVVVTASTSVPAPAISDSAGNSWTQILSPGGQGGTGVWYVYAPTTSSSHTFTISTADFITMDVLAYSGAISSPLDQSNSAGSSNQPGGGITPTVNGDLLIVGSGLTSAAGSFSVNDGFTTFNFTDENATSYGLGVATLVQATAAAINPTVTLGSGTPQETFIVSFKPGAFAVGTIAGQATTNAQSGMIGSITGAAVANAFAGNVGTIKGQATANAFAGNVGSISGIATVSGTSLAAFVTTFPTSNKDPSIMMILGFTPSQTLLYDYGNSENFFVQVLNTGDPWSSGFSSGFGGGPGQSTLYAVSPFFASQWFGSANGGPPLKTVWNPFPFATSKLSKLVQP